MAFPGGGRRALRVSYDGNVKVTLVKTDSGSALRPDFDRRLEQWRFFPAMKGGVAINSAFDVRIPISVQ